MTTNSTAFVSNDGTLDTGNVLQKATGEITLVDRTDTNLTASVTEVIATDKLYTLGALGKPTPVYVSGVVSSNIAAVITATANYSVASAAVTTGKVVTITDTELLKQTVTLACSTGTITVTGANGGVITNNTTTLVTVTGANSGDITYTQTSPTGPATVTLTFNATDGINAATQKTTTVTVAS